MEPQSDFTRDLQRLQTLTETDAVIRLMRSFVASVAQQMEHLSYLRIKAQTLIDCAQQLGLSGSDQAHTNAGGHILRDRLG
ncbi:hypothetical protein GCM10007386_12550 [Pseudoduganella dura]|nr:hypothetical protein GCM10007386_12550 [Pseudoduganella dura]